MSKKGDRCIFEVIYHDHYAASLLRRSCCSATRTSRSPIYFLNALTSGGSSLTTCFRLIISFYDLGIYIFPSLFLSLSILSSVFFFASSRIFLRLPASSSYLSFLNSDFYCISNFLISSAAVGRSAVGCRLCSIFACL